MTDKEEYLLSQERRDIAAKAVDGFLKSLQDFNGPEIASIITGLLVQWLATHCESSEHAMDVLGAISIGASTGLAHADAAKMTNWSMPDDAIIN